MQTLKNTLARICSISAARLRLCVELAHRESKKPKLFIFLDMAYCYLRYGAGYFDYYTFGFAFIGAARRKTFMTMNQNLSLVRRLNSLSHRALLDDKTEFNRLFAGQLGREWLDLGKADSGAFERFLKGKRRVFAKMVDQYGGKGIERIDVDAERDVSSLFDRLTAAGMYCVEDEIIQHPEMNLLSDSSVNSIRITTLEKGGEIHVMYALVRMSDGSGYVDNISSGGMFCPLDENGVITADAFCDSTGEYYKKHPKTGQVFEGFRIPYFNEAVELVRIAAQRVPEIRYVGWDVAVTEKGPVLIEGNVIPGYDICQNHRHIGPGMTGILPKFKAVLKDEFRQGVPARA